MARTIALAKKYDSLQRLEAKKRRKLIQKKYGPADGNNLYCFSWCL